VSQNGFDVFFSWASGFVNNFYPSLPLTGSFSDFAQAIARIQLQNNPQFQSLTPDEQSAALSQAAGNIVDSLTPSSTATSTAASAPTSNVLYNYFTSVTEKLHDRFDNFFVGAWGLILFLILRGIGIIVVWIGQFVALVVYELLLATGFMKIVEQPATKETIEF